jgi:yecA family protein
MTQPLFTYDEADILLREDGSRGYIGISAIDGLIAAVVAGPARIKTDGWLPEIFAGRVPVTAPGTPAHQLVQTILRRHDDVAETLARRPRQYQPIFMHDEGRMITHEWTVGFMCGIGLAADAWAPIMLSSFRSKLAPIFLMHPDGQRVMPAMPQAEVDRIKAHTHELIGGAVVALHKRCANDRYNAPRQNSQRAAWKT